MMVIRPIRQSDYLALLSIAEESGHGFTSLPVNEALLKAKISRSERAFKSSNETLENDCYLFVMVDTETDEVVGTSGIESTVGLRDPFYHYHQGKVTHYSNELNVYNTVDILTLGNDYTGATEICTLFLSKKARHGTNGRLLSRFRFLFMGQNKNRFSDTVVAEMRGVSDEFGQSPFWAWLQEHFFSMPFPDAVHRVGMGQKSFIAELMPKYPIYASLLSAEAQAVIGQVHEQTKPALALLEQEGFCNRGYVDIFDAGPTVEAKLDDILTVKNRQEYSVCIGELEGGKEYIISNLEVADYRATVATLSVNVEKSAVMLNTELASILKVSEGGKVSIIALR
ncbi:arginine N-succinyltransferase [Alkalimarinus sediminis]|uniref:Arginine N-succinyltransferase n=1 Tax=Alkalimarinus sediminis TaxID=1632866 RepID=A0A9E8HPW9_9ALTE|nr:arginine N-succinyltransferase [Alkalimarinus sediminis]UZW76563.1 arginine N-succinyltransferase [Alkalimarinus sediminis]